MRAVVLHETGGPDVLRVEETPEPVAGEGHVLVRTEAIGVAFYETYFRAGTYPMPRGLPAVFGSEAAGTVVAVGPGADAAWAGRRVVVMDTGMSGTYAEYAAVPAESLTPVPDGLSAADAVALAVPASVALCLLRAARAAGGETALVEAAAGGTGGYLAQMARAHGFGRVIATAGGAAKGERARELGADAVVDHTDPDWPERVREALGGATLDVVFDSIGGDASKRLLDLLAPTDGRLVFYGMLSGEPPAVGAADLVPRGLTLTACSGLEVWAVRVREARAEVLDLAVKGEIRPLVDSVRPLEDVAGAHRDVEERRAVGKIILTP